jgi:hypothetical protein
MKRDEGKLKIIRETVFKSIILEMETKLNDRATDERKRTEMIKYTRSRLGDLLNSFSEGDLLPKREIVSEQDFEKHILKIINKARNQLLNEMEKEF